MSQSRGPWWSRTWWGRRTTAVNIGLVAAVLILLAIRSCVSAQAAGRAQGEPPPHSDTMRGLGGR